MVGPWQVPVADVAVTLADFAGYAGEAMAMGERTPLALIDAPASGRMAVAEAITNLAAAPVAAIDAIRLSANWMAPAGHAGEDAALYDTVRAVSEFCIALGVSIPVGKDSMSMRTTWRDAGGDHAVTAPVSLVVTAFAPIGDVRETLTPLLRTGEGPTSLVLLDAGGGRQRLGASVLAQVYGQLGDESPDVSPRDLAALFAVVQQARRDGRLLAYHDVGDGGLFATLVEMAFASRCGLEIMLDGIDAPPHAALFAEEIGAVVQVDAGDTQALIDAARVAGLHACVVGAPASGDRIRVRTIDHVLLDEARVDLHRAWSATTHALQRLRDHPGCADEEYDRLLDAAEPPMPACAHVRPGRGPRGAVHRERRAPARSRSCASRA